MNGLCITSYLNFLSDQQLGFRKGFSTSMAALDLVNYINGGFEKRECTLSIFVDLSKAFDTVDHHILLQKLNYYGARGVMYNWFKGYLTNRKQLVRVNGHCSSFSSITCVVPQGSILGPLLFLVYINDLPYASSKLKFILFADDTSILFRTKNPSSIVPLLNDELILVSNWFKINKLSLNVKKTNFMIFQNRTQSYKDLEINVNGSPIKQTNNIKFLGLLIDPHLSWKDHINHLCNKLSRIVGVLYRVRFQLPSKILLTLYNSLIFSAISYCNIVWGNTFSTYVNKLFILQKRTIRLITSTDYSADLN